MTEDFSPKAPNIRSSAPQDETFQELVAEITAFRDSLSEEFDMGAYVANSDRPFHVKSFETRGHLFVFTGHDANEQDVTAIQHYTQLNLQLVKLRRLKKPSPVGFHPHVES